MGSRLALVAVVNDFEGMFLAKGNETGLKISGLGEGEHIRIVTGYEDLDPLTFTESGVFPLFLVRGNRIKIQKLNGGKSSTTVEILTNGNGTL